MKEYFKPIIEDEIIIIEDICNSSLVDDPFDISIDNPEGTDL